MNIILVSDSLATSRRVTLSQAQVVLALGGLLLAGFLLAIGTYWLTITFAADLGNPHLRGLLTSLHQEAQRKKEAEVQESLNALAVKVGELQARLLRLDAFASRLGKAAGLKASEFRFDEAPGQGGAAPSPALSRDLTYDELRQTLDAIARQVESSSDRMGVLDSVILDSQLARQALPTVLPVASGFYSSNFGYRIDPITGQSTFHAGVDIIAPPGTPVMAAAGGVVSAVGFQPEYGNTVDIQHDNGLTSRYAHLLKSQVREGDVVMKGQVIAQVGMSGRTTGPHLHFEVRERGIPLNPNKFFALDQRRDPSARPVAASK